MLRSKHFPITLEEVSTERIGEICHEILKFIDLSDTSKTLDVLILGANKVGLTALEIFLDRNAEVVLADFENPHYCTVKNNRFTFQNLSVVPSKTHTLGNVSQQIEYTLSSQEKTLLMLFSKADIVINTISDLHKHDCITQPNCDNLSIKDGGVYVEIELLKSQFQS